MKKLIAAVISFCMIFSCSTIGFADTNAFNDVDYSTDTGKNIQKLFEAGIINGYGDGSFAPGKPVTRAQLCKMINTICGFTEKSSDTFTDVSSDKWYYDQVLIGKKAGYINGFPDGSFKGDSYITREQVCAIICRAFGVYDLGIDANITDGVSDWARVYVNSLVANKLIKLEDGNTFRATEPMKRGELSNSLSNFVSSAPDTEQKPPVAGSDADVDTDIDADVSSDADNKTDNEDETDIKDETDNKDNENQNTGTGSTGGGGSSAGGGGSSAGGGGSSAGGGGSSAGGGGSSAGGGGSSAGGGGSSAGGGGSSAGGGGSSTGGSGTTPDSGTKPDSGTTPDTGTTPDSGTTPGTGTTPDTDTTPDTGDSKDEIIAFNENVIKKLIIIKTALDEIKMPVAYRSIVKNASDCMGTVIAAGPDVGEEIDSEYIQMVYKTEVNSVRDGFNKLSSANQDAFVNIIIDNLSDKEGYSYLIDLFVPDDVLKKLTS